MSQAVLATIPMINIQLSIPFPVLLKKETQT